MRKTRRNQAISVKFNQIRKMNEFKVEYLLIMEQGELCNDTKTLKNLLQATSDIVVQDEKLIFKAIEFDFYLTKKFEDANNRYFHLVLKSLDVSKLDDFDKLLRTIRTLIFNVKGKVEVLWNDISFYYSNKAYPLINSIENQMRKLITLFLIDSVGINWGKNAIPIELQDTKSNNFLHKTNFDHLGEILTKEYSINPPDNLFKVLKKTKKLEELNIDTLKSYIPKSNLDRYFKEYIDFDADYLKKKWAKLYELRCIVAHNNFLSKENFTDLETLIEEVKTKLKNAIDNIEKVKIPEEEKNSIIEFTLSNSNELLGIFINQWKSLENKLNRFFGEIRLVPPIKNLRKLHEEGYVTDEIIQQIMAINDLRNKLVHLSDSELSDDEIMRNVKRIRKFTKQLVFDDDFGDTWPFTVKKGLIINRKSAVLFRYKNEEYALNGVAITMGYKELEPIWKDNPKIPGTKISISTMINIGLEQE